MTVKSGALSPRNAEDLENILGWLTYQALRLEVERARSKPDDALDVRDLAFRAYVEWGSHPEQDPKAAYTTATRLLRRALALSPDDNLALYLTASVNLCDRVDGWSTNVAEQQAIGAAALDKYLQRNPRDALAAVERALELRDDPDGDALAAGCLYELADYEHAAQRAQKAAAEMSPQDLRNRKKGAVTLTWAAAEARLGHQARAAGALASFRTAVPNVDSLAAIQAWMHPAAYLAGYRPLLQGLRVAGARDD